MTTSRDCTGPADYLAKFSNVLEKCEANSHETQAEIRKLKKLQTKMNEEHSLLDRKIAEFIGRNVVLQKRLERAEAGMHNERQRRRDSLHQFETLQNDIEELQYYHNHMREEDARLQEELLYESRLLHVLETVLEPQAVNSLHVVEAEALQSSKEAHRLHKQTKVLEDKVVDARHYNSVVGSGMEMTLNSPLFHHQQP